MYAMPLHTHSGKKSGEKHASLLDSTRQLHDTSKEFYDRAKETLKDLQSLTPEERARVMAEEKQKHEKAVMVREEQVVERFEDLSDEERIRLLLHYARQGALSKTAFAASLVSKIHFENFQQQQQVMAALSQYLEQEHIESIWNMAHEMKAKSHE